MQYSRTEEKPRRTGSPAFAGDDDGVYPNNTTLRCALLRRELDIRRCGADVGVDVAFELGKVLLEHADQRAGGLVEFGLVFPGVDRIEDLARDTRQRGGNRKAEIFIGTEFHIAQATVEYSGEQRARHLDRHPAAGAVFAAGPAGIDQPAIHTVLRDQIAQHVAVDGGIERQERRTEAGRKFRLQLYSGPPPGAGTICSTAAQEEIPRLLPRPVVDTRERP